MLRNDWLLPGAGGRTCASGTSTPFTSCQQRYQRLPARQQRQASWIRRHLQALQ